MNDWPQKSQMKNWPQRAQRTQRKSNLFFVTFVLFEAKALLPFCGAWRSHKPLGTP
jgi:hypothetical protein